MTFFTSWVLWEKMTFVLAMAIGVVFTIGYGKLKWMERVARKQEQVDNEKRIRNAERRSNGQFVEAREIHDIPFGAKAIEYGVEVDDIWISNASDAVPLAEKTGRPARSSPESLSSMNHNGRGLENNQSSPSQSCGRSEIRQIAPPSLIHGSLSGSLDGEAFSRSRHSVSRISYKPRRSSQLCYEGTHCDQVRSEHLEDLQLRTSTDAAPEECDLLSSNRAAYYSNPNHPPFKPTSSHSAPNISRNNKITSTDMLPHASQSNLKLYTSEDNDNLAESSRYLVPQIQHSKPLQLPFIAGEPHANTATRKVNNGFTVLPAGTFDVSPKHSLSRSTVENREVEQELTKGRIHLHKLQNRLRRSISRRPY